MYRLSLPAAQDKYVYISIYEYMQMYRLSVTHMRRHEASHQVMVFLNAFRNTF